MNDLNKDIKITKLIFRIISIIVIIVGLGFSYLIAQLQDAPGFIFIGSTITLVGASLMYGFGELIITTKKNNALLSDIYKELINK